MNVQAARAPALRPLGLGEALDRAVTLTVRCFVALALVYVVYAIPLAIVQFLASRDLSHVLALLASAAPPSPGGAPRFDPHRLSQVLAASAAPTGWTALLIAFAVLVGPLPAAALIEAVATAYLGAPATFAQAYRVALSRWLPLIGLTLLYALAAVALYVVAALVFVVAFLLAVLASTAVHALGGVLGIVLLIVATVGLGAFGVVALLALQTSYFTCVVERETVLRSFTRGLRRVFGPAGWRRTLLFAAAYFACAAGILVLTLVGSALLVALVRTPLIATAYGVVVRVASAVFLTAFVAVFYFDLRVREEGFDLQLAARAARVDVLSTT